MPIPANAPNVNHVEQLLNRFLTPPKGRSPEEVKEKILHWIDAHNDPAKYTKDPSPYGVAAVRKKARQNVRRLVMRHPSIAAQIQPMREVKQ
jgi:hypothetical protein